jgi:hypothetical protein
MRGTLRETHFAASVESRLSAEQCIAAIFRDFFRVGGGTKFEELLDQN